MIQDAEIVNTFWNQELQESKEFEGCTFKNCKFEKADLSSHIFSECRFENCDLSLANLNDTRFCEVTFEACKMLGMRFDYCNPFLLEMHFRKCVLDQAIFYQLKLVNTTFEECRLHESDFTEVNLSGTNITDCDLSGARFNRCNLHKTDFTGSLGFEIDPDNNNIKQAVFSEAALSGLLIKYNLKIKS